MFKVSQDINLNLNDNTDSIVNHTNFYGKYQSAPVDESYKFSDKQIFVSPEVTEINKIEILHLPTKAVKIGQKCEFIIKKNDARGNIEAKLISPSNKTIPLTLDVVDPDRFNLNFIPVEEGYHTIHIKFNTVELPKSPFSIFAEMFEDYDDLKSNVKRVKYQGNGLKQISLKQKNEFTIDASKAGTNILFVSVCGPKGQSDEVYVKHLGNHIYHVEYKVQDKGEYVIIAKWGDEHIIGSPFILQTKK